MGLVTRAALVLILVTPSAVAQIVPEEISVETTPDRGENWFIGKTGNGGYIFDATDGEMKGICLLYTSPSPRDKRQSRMPSSA